MLITILSNYHISIKMNRIIGIDDIININNLDQNNVKIVQKYHTKIFYVGYVIPNNFNLYNSLSTVEVVIFIKINGNNYLRVTPIDESKVASRSMKNYGAKLKIF